MNAFVRRGACPTLANPMPTGDGLLARLNPIGGMAPALLSALCAAARAHGNGIVEVTARGSLQIRGVRPDSAPLLAARVGALGIPIQERIVVAASPLAGLDPAEQADPAALAAKIRLRLAETGLRERLAPKVSVVVDGGGALPPDTVAADLRLTAEGPEHWRLALAGDAVSAALLGSVPQDSAAEAAILVLEAVAARGGAARGRALLAPAVLAYLRAELSARCRLRQAAPVATNHPRQKNPFDPVPLAGGRIAAPVALPFGSAEAAVLEKLAAAVQALGVAQLRLAPGRVLLAIAPSPQAAQAFVAAAGTLGFVTGADDPRANFDVCAGAPACASARIATRPLAEAMAARLAGRADRGMSVHVSGCAKGCARQAPARLTVVGEPEGGAAFVVNGTVADAPSMHAGAGDLVKQALALLAAPPPAHAARNPETVGWEQQ